jgi:hypothetical protein
VQNRKQCRVDEQCLWITHQLGDNLAAQELQETSEPPYPSMERVRVKSHYSQEQLREEPLCLAQERALALHASKLLEEREGDDLRVRKPLEGFVASSTGVEMSVSVVDEAKEDGEGLFRARCPPHLLGKRAPRVGRMFRNWSSENRR